VSSVAESKKLAENIVRLRHAERVPAVAPYVSPVRRDLESQLGPTLSRSRAARILGVSQTALDRWVAAGQIPIVFTPNGRREVPRQFVVEVGEAIDELRGRGRRRHLLASALTARRESAGKIGAVDNANRPTPSALAGHQTAERRSLAYHEVVAERLTEPMVEEARERVEWLASRGHLHPGYAKRWRNLLSRPVVEVASAISANDEEGRDLRQNSPFAGVLNEQERRRIIEAVH
jgi:hypothetical protein